MGFYGCNNATITRTKDEQGNRVIKAAVTIDDLGGKEYTHVVKGFDENAVKVAAEWVVQKMADLSM